MSLGPCPWSENRRSRMPVLVTIHSWEVSTTLARSALVTVLSGTYAPTPVTRMPIRCLPRCLRSASAPPRSGTGAGCQFAFRQRTPVLQKASGLRLTVLAQVREQFRSPIELASRRKIPIEQDPGNADGAKIRIVDHPSGDRAIECLDEPQFLLHRKIPGQ